MNAESTTCHRNEIVLVSMYQTTSCWSNSTPTKFRKRYCEVRSVNCEFTPAYISMAEELIMESITTHAPPRSSQPGGRYTITGHLYVRSASTMHEPACNTPSKRSRCPPEKPRQLAKMTKGRPSRSNSCSACAVLSAESGYHTCTMHARHVFTPRTCSSLASTLKRMQGQGKGGRGGKAC